MGVISAAFAPFLSLSTYSTISLNNIASLDAILRVFEFDHQAGLRLKGVFCLYTSAKKTFDFQCPVPCGSEFLSKENASVLDLVVESKGSEK